MIENTVPIVQLIVVVVVLCLLATKATAWHSWVSASQRNRAISVIVQLLSVIISITCILTKSEVVVVQLTAMFMVMNLWMHMLFSVVERTKNVQGNPSDTHKKA